MVVDQAGSSAELQREFAQCPGAAVRSEGCQPSGKVTGGGVLASTGLNSPATGTLAGRTTRFMMLLHVPPVEGHGSSPWAKNGQALAGHGAEAVRDAIASAITTRPGRLRRSLTWDQGAEMAGHARLRTGAGTGIYFCDPHSPWQRGTSENTSGLLRQYFPKGTDLSR